MADPSPHSPSLLLLAMFSRRPEALAWARNRAEEKLGLVALSSPPFAFDSTDYYERTMGPEIVKQFLAFSRPFDPGDLAALKLQTNAWEREYAAQAHHEEPRPLNLDPGYLTLGKLVLASAKDFAHRIYLGQGIYAEITLHYRAGRWQPHEWTFPDYRREDYHAFFDQCRAVLHEHRRTGWKIP